MQDEEPKRLNTMADQKVVSLTAEQHALWRKAVQPIFSSWNEQDKTQADTVLTKARELAAAVKTGH